MLALDTTDRAGSVAGVRDAIVLAETAGDPAITHGQRLPGELERSARRRRRVARGCRSPCRGRGPGLVHRSARRHRGDAGTGDGAGANVSFRCRRSRRWRASAVDTPIARSRAWMDAQRGEVFAALYTPDGREQSCARTDGASARGNRGRIATVAAAPRITFVGDGAARYADAHRARRWPATRQVARPLPRLAGVDRADRGRRTAARRLPARRRADLRPSAGRRARARTPRRPRMRPVPNATRAAALSR